MRYVIAFIVVLGLSALLIGGSSILVAFLVSSRTAKSIKVQNNIDLHGGVDESVYFFSDPSLVDANKRVAKQLSSQMLAEQEMLFNLSRLIPKEAWLTKLVQVKSALTLRGYAFTNKDLATFIDVLTKHSTFNNVKLSYSKPTIVDNTKVYHFEIECDFGVQAYE